MFLMIFKLSAPYNILICSCERIKYIYCTSFQLSLRAAQQVTARVNLNKVTAKTGFHLIGEVGVKTVQFSLRSLELSIKGIALFLVFHFFLGQDIE